MADEAGRLSSAAKVEAVQAASKDVILWDGKVPGFGLKVTPAGRRTFFLFYRTKDGQQRKPAIGTYPAMTPGGARKIASRWLADVARGDDPSGTRQEARVAPTLAEVCTRYLTEHSSRKKETSRRNDERLINNRILPILGRRKIAAIERPEIVALHQSLAATPYEANRTLALLSTIFSQANRWGFRTDGSNPARNIGRFREEKRERFLTTDEIARLWKVLDEEEATASAPVAALRLLLLTGRRLSEVLTLQWKWVDLEAGLLALPDTKTGALRLPLATGAIALLKELRARPGYDSVYVIPGRIKGQPLVNLQKPWRRLRALAGLEDVRIHDLRHSFASIAAGAGLSLLMIGKLLGHTQASTTQRYAHLQHDPIRAAANLIDLALASAIGANG